MANMQWSHQGGATQAGLLEIHLVKKNRIRLFMQPTPREQTVLASPALHHGS